MSLDFTYTTLDRAYEFDNAEPLWVINLFQLHHVHTPINSIGAVYKESMSIPSVSELSLNNEGMLSPFVDEGSALQIADVKCIFDGIYSTDPKLATPTKIVTFYFGIPVELTRSISRQRILENENFTHLVNSEVLFLLDSYEAQNLLSYRTVQEWIMRQGSVRNVGDDKELQNPPGIHIYEHRALDPVIPLGDTAMVAHMHGLGIDHFGVTKEDMAAIDAELGPVERAGDYFSQFVFQGFKPKKAPI